MSFGRTELPDTQAATLRRAIRLRVDHHRLPGRRVTLVGLVLGNSQAMKAAWVEDLLSLAPPIAFLVAVRIIRHAAHPEAAVRLPPLDRRRPPGGGRRADRHGHVLDLSTPASG